MSDIRPFRALRPRPELAARVAAPPYDVINSDEARALAAGNPYSFLHVGKPEIDLPPTSTSTTTGSTPRARATSAPDRREASSSARIEPALYVYQQRMGDHVQAGLVVRDARATSTRTA